MEINIRADGTAYGCVIPPRGPKVCMAMDDTDRLRDKLMAIWLGWS